VFRSVWGVIDFLGLFDLFGMFAGRCGDGEGPHVAAGGRGSTGRGGGSAPFVLFVQVTAPGVVCLVHVGIG
jgi:hypothetical protein